ncbi:MAG: hypothetical protein ABWX84_05325 [Nocardioides sp.]
MVGLSLVLAAALTLVWLTRSDEEAPPSLGRLQARPDLAAATLQRLVSAVDDENTRPDGLVDPEDPAALAWGSGVLANVHSLRVRDFSARYVDADPSDSAGLPEGQWAAAVETTWRFAGFDRRPARAEVTFTFAVRDGRAVIVDAGGGDRPTPLWLTGPLDVRRSADTLVATDAGGGAAPYARYARRAIPVVRRVLPQWRGKLVVEVPGGPGGLDEMLAADPGEYANIAAVTTSVDGDPVPGAPVHVLVNPQVFGDLKPRGAQVVMSHEATHVATEAAASRTPLWLLEGFADYVALRDERLPLSTSAGQIIHDVRRDGAPRELPGGPEFDTQTARLGAAYESAWLAVRLLADIGGERRLVSFYRRVSSGRPLEATLRSVYGFGEAGLTARWRAELKEIAS